jgi:hypothetical protein
MIVRLLVFFTLVLCVPSFTLAADYVTTGSATRSDYIKWDSNAQMTWVIGVMDGIMMEGALASQPIQQSWLGSCLANHDTAQLKAIFEKELNENPEWWHLPISMIYRSSVKPFCEGPQ